MLKHKVLPRLWALVIVALLLFALTGCNSDGEMLSPEDEEEADPTEETVQVLLFFAEARAVNSGEPGAYGFVAPVVRAVAAGEDLLMAALGELIRGPLPDDGDLFTTLPATSKILGLQIDGEVVIIDFSHELLSDSPGGTLGGTVFMQSIVLTATQFPGVAKVMVLVEGDPWCDGHMIWEVPLGPDDLEYGGDDGC
jgi:spore germination protein GerM